MDIDKFRQRNIYKNYGLPYQDQPATQSVWLDDPEPMENVPFESAPMERPPFQRGTNPFEQKMDEGRDPTTNPFEPKPVPQMSSDISFETPQQEKYQALLSARPERENPGLMRATVAAAMGWGARDKMKTMDDVMYGPYNQKMADWQSQIEPQAKAAQLENTTNNTKRQMETSIRNNETQTARYEQQNKLGYDRLAETQRNNDLRNKIAEEKQELAQLKYDNPDIKFDFSTPTIKYTDARGQLVDTGVETGHMSKMDEIKLNQKNRVELEHVKGDERRETQAAPRSTGSGTKGNFDYIKARKEYIQEQYDTGDDDTRAVIELSKTATGSDQLVKPTPSHILGWKVGSDAYNKKLAAYERMQKDLRTLGTPMQAGSDTTLENKEYPGLAAGETPKYAQGQSNKPPSQPSQPAPAKQWPTPPPRTPRDPGYEKPPQYKLQYDSWGKEKTPFQGPLMERAHPESQYYGLRSGMGPNIEESKEDPEVPGAVMHTYNGGYDWTWLDPETGEWHPMTYDKNTGLWSVVEY